MKNELPVLEEGVVHDPRVAPEGVPDPNLIMSVSRQSSTSGLFGRVWVNNLSRGCEEEIMPSYSPGPDHHPVHGWHWSLRL